ncbi:MerR family transcriptional regulator [Floricoccus tropicus]|uniref:MerR family transcriptional regulator n=1 Tax=Floricoccus tropicus TaxID=1859473 RepID=A0A1E8GL73_9LACT|nr:MerR family transcriptional regulator [Floricoccus tropicus]OFI49004.1 MerR family transcriptional regulator [Floricoccus tropicus]
MGYLIGEFSNITGLSVDTLRYYEKEKLIFSHRDNINRRIYNDSDVKWIEFTIRLKKTGMKISDMKLYAELRYIGDSTVPDRLKLLNTQLEKLENDRKKLNEDIEFLNQKINIYKELLPTD